MLAVAAAACCRCPSHSTGVFRCSHRLRSYLDARDPALARLRQLSHSPAAWFRCPFAHVVLVSCLEVGAATRAPAESAVGFAVEAAP